MDAHRRPLWHPDARALVQALHQEQLATYGTAEDPEATEEAEFDALTACSSSPGSGTDRHWPAGAGAP